MAVTKATSPIVQFTDPLGLMYAHGGVRGLVYCHHLDARRHLMANEDPRGGGLGLGFLCRRGALSVRLLVHDSLRLRVDHGLRLRDGVDEVRVLHARRDALRAGLEIEPLDDLAGGPDDEHDVLRVLRGPRDARGVRGVRGVRDVHGIRGVRRPSRVQRVPFQRGPYPLPCPGGPSRRVPSPSHQVPFHPYHGVPSPYPDDLSHRIPYPSPFPQVPFPSLHVPSHHDHHVYRLYGHALDKEDHHPMLRLSDPWRRVSCLRGRRRGWGGGAF